jgi:hypothetical protein
MRAANLRTKYNAPLEPYAEPSSPLAAIPIIRSKIARVHAYSCGFETLRTSV